MAKSKNNKITKRGNHAQRVLSHDNYLIKNFPDFANTTNPYTAVVAEMLEEEIREAAQEFQPNQETIEAITEAEIETLPRFNTVKELMADLNSDIECPVIKEHAKLAMEHFEPTLKALASGVDEIVGSENK